MIRNRIHAIRGVVTHANAIKAAAELEEMAADNQLNRVVWEPGEEPGTNTYGEGRASYVGDMTHPVEAFDLDRLARKIILTLARDLGRGDADFLDGSTWASKVYVPGDFQGTHTDTNTVTVLLFLTKGYGPVFVVDGETDPWSYLDMYPGDVLVFDGAIPHYVPPVEESRVVITFSLYTPDNPKRPEWADRLVHGD